MSTLAQTLTSGAAYMDPVKLMDTDIFTLLGVPDAPQEKKDSLMATILNSIQNRVFSRVLDRMDDDAEAEEFVALLEKDEPDAARKFLMDHSIDLPTLAFEEAVLYKTELATLVATASN